VIVHEGYVSRKEAARLAKAEGSDGADASAARPARPEVTRPLQTYLDLHRHAAVRAALLAHLGIALRLMVAHAIAGSHLWSVRAEPQATRDEAVRESLDNSKAEADFGERRRAVLAVLGLAEDEPTVTGGGSGGMGVCGVFQRLLELPDAVVMEVVAIVIGETLAAGSAAVEAVGLEIGVEMSRYWQADDAFFSALRDREVLTRIVAEVGGEAVASANAGETTKTLKTIVRDHLAGDNGRPKREHWVPRWMTFPPSAYTARGGVGTVAAHARAQAAQDLAPTGDGDPDPAAPGALVALPDSGDEEAGTDRLAA